MKIELLSLLLLLGLRTAAWAGTAPFGWGINSNGSLGDGTTTDRTTPIAVDVSGVLSGKDIVDISVGYDHSLAVSSDGQVFAWGDNYYGQLGDGTTTASNSPVAVDMSGVLSGKTVVAVASGTSFSTALTSDGQIYTWGLNDRGQLGDGTTTDHHSPVAVDTSGVLSGKVVTSLDSYFFTTGVVSTDGLVFTWGAGTDGQLGDGSVSDSSVPVAVDTSGALSGQTVVGISASGDSFLVVCSNGKLYSWGTNTYGRLGDGTTTNRTTPVEVDSSGALYGKTMIATCFGGSTSFGLASDGTVYGWGYNGTTSGLLGAGLTSTMETSPVAVDMSGTLLGKTVTAVAAGGGRCLVLTSDGELFAWGSNNNLEFGDGTTISSPTAVPVDMSGALGGMSVTKIDAAVFAALVLASPSTTTISPGSRLTYGANFGWLNWRWSGSAAEAPVIESTMLHGSVYAADVGWIDLGDGTPSGLASQYTQSGGDIGVNHDGAGNLSGYAYGANIGWIYFDPTIASPPRVDLTTGDFSGYAYSANCGWINLAGIRTRIHPGVDLDLLAGGVIGDGIADSWEQEQTALAGYGSSLTLLGSSPDADFDHDGMTDYQEFLADTNPFVPGDRLAITNFLYDSTSGNVDLEWTGSQRRAFLIECSPDLINWSPVGDPLTGGTAFFTLTGPAVPHFFFKVQAMLPTGGQ